MEVENNVYRTFKVDFKDQTVTLNKEEVEILRKIREIYYSTFFHFYICFSNIPHHCHDYVIYALGKVYGIPMSFCSDTSIPPRLATCTDMENVWKDTYEKYLEYRELPASELSLPEDLEHYYKALLYKNKGLDDIKKVCSSRIARVIEDTFFDSAKPELKIKLSLHVLQ